MEDETDQFIPDANLRQNFCSAIGEIEFAPSSGVKNDFFFRYRQKTAAKPRTRLCSADSGSICHRLDVNINNAQFSTFTPRPFTGFHPSPHPNLSLVPYLTPHNPTPSLVSSLNAPLTSSPSPHLQTHLIPLVAHTPPKEFSGGARLATPPVFVFRRLCFSFRRSVYRSGG